MLRPRVSRARSAASASACAFFASRRSSPAGCCANFASSSCCFLSLGLSIADIVKFPVRDFTEFCIFARTAFCESACDLNPTDIVKSNERSAIVRCVIQIDRPCFDIMLYIFASCNSHLTLWRQVRPIHRDCFIAISALVECQDRVLRWAQNPSDAILWGV